MQATDEIAFAALIAKTWRFYDKKPTGETVADWFEILTGFDLAAIATAFQHHLIDPKAGQYLPKPADVIRHLPATDDGHPGPDEAWGLLVRLIQDERETGVLTEEMRAGWEACQPILDLGDEVGARMCFLDVYRRRIQEARQTAKKARWTPTLGTDPTLRVQRLQEAVEARRISADYAHSLLPGPTPVSLDAVAGLLEGPDASPQEQQTAARFRDLAQLVRNMGATSDRHWAEQRQQEREAAAEQKRQAIAAAEAELLKRGILTVPNDQKKAA
jgi:hypothetical protein